jgi:hypothetical protein
MWLLKTVITGSKGKVFPVHEMKIIGGVKV